MSQPDTFDGFKRRQREMWASFTPTAIFTTPVAGHLVRFAGIAAGENVLDVGTGTGVVAITAARAGAEVTGLDLTPELLVEARENARIAQMEQIVWTEGDAETLPYPDRSFDVVVSQFDHMFCTPARGRSVGDPPRAQARRTLCVCHPAAGASHWPLVRVHRRQLAASASGSGAAAAVGKSCDCRRALGREL